MAGPLIVYGCAAPRVDVPATPAVLLEGRIDGRAGRPGVVVGAPHGTSDARTAEIATTIAERTGFGFVIASGFAVERDTRRRAGRRYHVNRPFEGVAGRPSSQETQTPQARRVYEEFVRRVSEVAQGPLLFYVEIHGNSRPQTAGRIEIATVGVDRELALRLRTLAEMIRDAHVRAHPEVVRLDILVEPADPVFHTASGAKRDGILTLPLQGLHLELPAAARMEFADVYTAVLADFLGQAVSLPAGR